MNDTVVTVMGNVVTEPRHRVTASGIHVATIRVATTSRKFDRGQGEWRDNNTIFFDVSCWRALADNVMASVHQGDPLVVTGRLKMKSYISKEGEQRTTPEIDASTLGHDLGRGVAHFQKAKRYVAPERRATPASQGGPWTVPPSNEAEVVAQGSADEAGVAVGPNETEGAEGSNEAWAEDQLATHLDSHDAWHDLTHALAQPPADEERAAA